MFLFIMDGYIYRIRIVSFFPLVLLSFTLDLRFLQVLAFCILASIRFNGILSSLVFVYCFWSPVLEYGSHRTDWLEFGL